MIKKITIFFLCLMILPAIKIQATTYSPISIEMHYLVISPTENDAVSVMNMVNYTNTSTEDVKGEETSGAVLQVTLPAGAKEFRFLDDKMKHEKSPVGFYTTDILPANQTIVLPYSYKIDKDKSINLKLDYPVQMMQVLVPEGAGSVEFSGAEAINQGTFNFEDQNYVGYSLENIEANKTLVMKYDQTKLPTSSEGPNSGQKQNEKLGEVSRTAPAFHNPGHLRIWEQSSLRNFNPHVLLIVLGAILMAGISYFSYFRWKHREGNERLEGDQEERIFKQLIAKQNAIMDKILELEESHEAGEISENDYESKLKAYKHHLVHVKMSLRKFVE